VSKLEPTDAIEILDPNAELVQGYRHDTYVSEQYGNIPTIVAAASKSVLFDLFVSLIYRLGDTVDVVLDGPMVGDNVLWREEIDTSVLVSVLIDFEDLVLNCGCLGVAVLNSHHNEVQLEEHKVLVIYGSPQELFEFDLESYDVFENEGIRTVNDYDHRHVLGDDHEERLNELRVALGLDGTDVDDDNEMSNYRKYDQ